MVLVVDFSWVPKLETSAAKITGHIRNRLIGGTYHIRGLSGNMPRKYGLKNGTVPPFLVGGRTTPLKNMLVSWDYEIPNI